MKLSLSIILQAALGIILLIESADLAAQPKSQSSKNVEISPKSPWGEFVIEEEDKKRPWWTHVLLWVPNRVLDFTDIFRADVGVGPAMGGVVRFSKHGQAGYRKINPASVRVGLFGRQVPFLIENSDEYGVGPNYVASKDRKVCKGELGVGADLFLVGAYAGVCADEIADFLAGIFFIDVSDDDIR